MAVCTVHPLQLDTVSGNLDINGQATAAYGRRDLSLFSVQYVRVTTEGFTTTAGATVQPVVRATAFEADGTTVRLQDFIAYAPALPQTTAAVMVSEWLELPPQWRTEDYARITVHFLGTMFAALTVYRTDLHLR